MEYKIVPINSKIYRGYDLRGVMDEDLSEDAYYTLGRGYATYLAQRRIPLATVGRDNRLNGEVYARAFIQGLNDGGINTIDLGYSLSQIVYFSAYHFKTRGYAMITASHNSKEFNGLKLGCGYSETMVSEDIQYFRKLVENKNFSTGKGTNTQQEIFSDYKNDILKYYHLNKKWKIVIDTCNTTSGLFYPEIFRSAGCEVIEQNTKLDSNFPLGVPDPTEVEVLDRLAKGVKAANADLGFAYDADGDRMAVVDDLGNTLWMDTIVALFAKDVLKNMPGAQIIFNNLCSRQVTETIEMAGGRPFMWVTGHSFLKAKMKELRAPFTGELSGHIFFNDNFFGHDDAAFASLRLLQYLESESESLSQAVAKLPHYVSSPEVKLGLADEIKFQLIKEEIAPLFKTTWPEGEFSEIDGIRMDTSDQMAVVRASQNGPYITIKFEGKTQEQYDDMKSKLNEILHKFNEIDWSKGVNTHAID